MIKRVIFFVGLFMFVFPVGSAFAETDIIPEPYDYKNGLLDDENIIKKITIPEEYYDNDLTTTSSRVLTNNYIEFTEPVNINYVYHKANKNGDVFQHIYINFVGGEGERIRFTSKEGFREVDYKDVIKITFNGPNAGYRLYEFEVFGSYGHFEINDIENVNHTSTNESINLMYDLPDEFDQIEINANGKTYETTNDNFTIKNLQPDTSYDITFYTVLDGIKSEGVTYTAKTEKEPEPPAEKEVTNVKAKTKHNRVDLSWDLPESDEFDHVTIYRKMLENNTSSIFNLIVPKTYASDAYDPIFETNGTYFNDLTVEAATGYEYKLTSTHDGKETPGVTVQATTAPPIVEGGGIEKNENGDYVYKWNEPTTGQIKIYVDGKEYATADASDGTITIPADDMKYNAFGDPLVTSQAIAPNGTPGNIGNGNGGTLAGIVLPFEVNDLVESGNSLIYLVGGFVLLALSFLLIPRLIRLIRESFNSYKNSGQDRRVRG